MTYTFDMLVTLRLNSEPVPPRAKRGRRAAGAVSNAMACGLVARNVARLVERPKVASRDTSTWTPEQATRFREHISDDRVAACWLLTFAGLRRSEILGLRWADVSFDAGTVTVAGVVSWPPQRCVGRGKT